MRSWRSRWRSERPPSGDPAPADLLRRRVEEAALSVTGAVVVAVDLTGRVCYVNAAAQRLTGYAEPELVGRLMHEVLLPADEVPDVQALLAQLAAGSAPLTHENDWITREGARRRLVFVNTLLPDEQGGGYVVAAGIDVTAERRAQQLSQAVLAATTEQALIATDTQGRVTLFNAGAERMLGYAAPQVLGRDVAHLFHDLAELAERAAALGLPAESVIAAAAQAGGADTHTWTYRRADGSCLRVALSVTALRDRTGELQGYLGVAVDVSAQQQREQELRRIAEQASYRASHDALTGLANGALLLDRLQHALAALSRHGRSSGLLYLDVDGLKDVNDRYGHAAGNALLVAVGHRLSDVLRDGDLCARIGGDEFAVLVEDLQDPAELDLAAERIQRRLQDPLRLPGGAITVPAASIGTTLLGVDDSPESALHRADSAMYEAKTRRGVRR